jgi:hypothetical protein
LKSFAFLHIGVDGAAEEEDDDDVPELVENFDEACKGEEKVKSEGVLQSRNIANCYTKYFGKVVCIMFGQVGIQNVLANKHTKCFRKLAKLAHVMFWQASRLPLFVKGGCLLNIMPKFRFMCPRFEKNTISGKPSPVGVV